MRIELFGEINHEMVEYVMEKLEVCESGGSGEDLYIEKKPMCSNTMCSNTMCSNYNESSDIMCSNYGGSEMLEVYINSPGGSVFSGSQILSLIGLTGMKTCCYIDGMCASMAADIAMTCDEVKMSKWGLLMFHDCWMTGDDMSESDAMFIRKQSDLMREMVSQKRGISRQKFDEFCASEYWFSADEALSNNLIDEIYDNIVIKEEYKTEVMNQYEKVKNSKIINQVPEFYKIVNKYMETEIEKEIEVTAINSDYGTLINVETPVKEVKEVDETESIIGLLRNKIIELEEKVEEYVKKETLANIEKFNIEVESILTDAIKVGKIKSETKPQWINLFKGAFTETKSIIETLPSTNVLERNDVLNLITKSTPNDRSSWTYDDWQKKDDKGLSKMSKEQPAQYDVLLRNYLKK
jgi:ATP-dependent Clp protease protease subunit